MEGSAPTPTHNSTSSDLPDNLVRDMDRDALSQLIREVNDNGNGVSYKEMEDRSDAAGAFVSKPYFQKMATNSAATAPSPTRLRGIAAALRLPLPVVQRAAAIQFLDYRATELSGYDDDVRVIVAHLAGMDKTELRRWKAMIEADEHAKREDD